MRLLKAIFIIALIFGIARFCHHQTAGFRMAKIEGNTFLMECPAIAEKSCFKQKFRYFGRGLQSFSFLSEDGTLVLKIFNNRYQNRIFWLQHLPFFADKVKCARQKLQRNFTSYQIAYEQLKEETGVLYFHPSVTNYLNQKVTLIDKLGIEHELDLDKTGFLVQKRALLFYSYLDQLMETGQLDEAKNALSSYIAFVKKRCEKGIGDNDPLIRANAGFYEGRPMQIDVGPFYLDDSLKNPEICKKQLERAALSLKHHLENSYPELGTYLHEIMEKN